MHDRSANYSREATTAIEKRFDWNDRPLGNFVSKTARSALPIFAGITLAACGKTLDTGRIAQVIQDDVIKQGGVSVKAVTCPKTIEPKAGATFECMGEMDSGYTFTIPVKQKDDQGTVTWDVPHARGLVNLAKFETLVQEAVQSEVGARPLIRCGAGFKAVREGQTFECKVERREDLKAAKDTKTAKTASAAGDGKANPPAKTTKAAAPTKPDKIVVNIDARKDITWERVLPVVATKPSPGAKPGQPDAAQKAGAAGTAAAASGAEPTKSGAAAAPAQKEATDFLNQPGAADGFD